MNQPKEMAAIACRALEDKKGQDVTVIDISKVSCLADYFIIANGENRIRCRPWWTTWKRRWRRPDTILPRERAIRRPDGSFWITRTWWFTSFPRTTEDSMTWSGFWRDGVFVDAAELERANNNQETMVQPVFCGLHLFLLKTGFIRYEQYRRGQ